MSEAAMPTFPTAEQLAAMSPQTKASAEAAFARYFPHAKDAIKQAFAGTPPVPKRPDAPDRTSLPINAGPSPDVFAQHYQNLAKHWSGDPEALKAAAKADGVDLDALSARQQVTTETIAAERQASIIAQLSPPETPGRYRLTIPGAAEMDTRELVKFDGEARSAFHAAGVPQSLAQGLLDALICTANTYADITKLEAHELRHREEGARFKKLPGDAIENVRLASLAYNALPEQFRKDMDAVKAFHSAQSQAALLAVGRALAEKERRLAAAKK